MTKLEQIAKAVETLPDSELAAFQAWFEEFQAERFDRKIEADVTAGRLDLLVEKARADLGCLQQAS
jgi:hypothetical protein